MGEVGGGEHVFELLEAVRVIHHVHIVSSRLAIHFVGSAEENLSLGSCRTYDRTLLYETQNKTKQINKEMDRFDV